MFFHEDLTFNSTCSVELLKEKSFKFFHEKFNRVFTEKYSSAKRKNICFNTLPGLIIKKEIFVLFFFSY